MIQKVFIDSDDFQFSDGIIHKFTKILDQAEKDVRNLLPGLSQHLTFTVWPTSQVIPETGETAATVDTSWIRFSIDPNHKRSLDEIVDTELRRTFFHEAHHATRIKTEQWGESLVSDAIFEGSATVFERDFTDGEPLWGQYDPEVIEDWTADFLSAQNDRSKKQEWFIKHPDGRRWIAYKVGTYIVDQALMHNSSETAATLVNVSSAKILEMSQVAR